MEIKWQRDKYPAGVPFWTSDAAPGWVISANQTLSTHTGIVFGRVSCEAGREARTTSYRVEYDGHTKANLLRTLADAKSYVERRLPS